MIDGYVPQKDIFVVSYKKYLQKIMDDKIQELDLTKKYKALKIKLDSLRETQTKIINYNSNMKSKINKS